MNFYRKTNSSFTESLDLLSMAHSLSIALVTGRGRFCVIFLDTSCLATGTRGRQGVDGGDRGAPVDPKRSRGHPWSSEDPEHYVS